jgi:hypothetical protein
MSWAQRLELVEQLAVALALLGLSTFAAYLWRAREAVAITFAVVLALVCGLFMSSAFLGMLNANWPLATIGILVAIAAMLISYPRAGPLRIRSRLRRVLTALVAGSVVWVVLGLATLAFMAMDSSSQVVRVLSYAVLVVYSPSMLPGMAAHLAGWLSIESGQIQPLAVAVPFAWLQTVLMAYWVVLFADWRADRGFDDDLEPLELAREAMR